MPSLKVREISLAYDDVGPREAPDTIVLLHGFSSNRDENWRRVGWLGAFERRRMRAIAFDLPGHGESDKPHDPAAYQIDALTADLVAALDALGVPSASLMGYSMGARLSLAIALAQPERFDRLILGGVGGRMFDAPPPGNPMAEAMEAANAEAISDPLLKSFRMFADEQGEDRKALAAFARARGGSGYDRNDLARLRMPTLVVAGARDALAGSPDDLAAEIPGGRGVTLPGCDHFSAIAHALFKAAVFDFLEETAT
ncbi:MAG TPA: alpha/beta fold hydrolase [Rhizomicrobium sp.]|nr:alpha/beta fold hydrolase [Rhizomicrobium sp.]